MGIFDAMLRALTIVIITRTEKGAAWALSAQFGYGIGTGAGKAGVRQTSGKPKFIPTPRLDAGSMIRPSAEVNLFAVDRHLLLREDGGGLRFGEARVVDEGVSLARPDAEQR